MNSRRLISVAWDTAGEIVSGTKSLHAATGIVTFSVDEMDGKTLFTALRER